MTDEWINDYVGVPHLTNGRTREGWDCWGLIMAVFKEQRGVILPDWQVDTLPGNVVLPAVQAHQMTEFVARESERALEVPTAEPWAIAVVRRHSMAHHVAVVVGASLQVLHCSRATRGTACEPLARFLTTHPNTSFWRLREFDANP